MATYDTLPIYASCYDFLIRMMHVITHFPKEYKYTLGERIQNTAIEMVICIYRVNTAKYKSQNLKLLLNQVQMMYLLLRISHDIKILPTEKYASLIQTVDDISRQSHGWLKAVDKQIEKPVGNPRESAQVTA